MKGLHAQHRLLGLRDLQSRCFADPGHSSPGETKKQDRLARGEAVSDSGNSLQELSRRTIRNLVRSFKGVGDAKAVTLLAAIIMGSGNAPFLAFVELIPQIAASMGVNTAAMILPMQQASHMGRAMSPVSGVIIAVSSGAKLTPFAVIKRTSVPLMVGFVFHTLIVGIFYL